MRMEFLFFNEYPYLYLLRYSFIESPKLVCSVKAYNAVDLMDLPVIKEWIESSLKSLLFNTLVLPQHVSLPYTRLFGISETTSTHERQEDISKHTTEIEQSLSSGGWKKKTKEIVLS